MKWTEAMRAKVRKRYPTEGPGKLAYELGVSRSAVAKVARQEGVQLLPQISSQLRRRFNSRTGTPGQF